MLSLSIHLKYTSALFTFFDQSNGKSFEVGMLFCTESHCEFEWLLLFNEIQWHNVWEAIFRSSWMSMLDLVFIFKPSFFYCSQEIVFSWRSNRRLSKGNKLHQVSSPLSILLSVNCDWAPSRNQEMARHCWKSSDWNVFVNSSTSDGRVVRLNNS